MHQGYQAPGTAVYIESPKNSIYPAIHRPFSFAVPEVIDKAINLCASSNAANLPSRTTEVFIRKTSLFSGAFIDFAR
jgi:hypothetical protein